MSVKLSFVFVVLTAVICMLLVVVINNVRNYTSYIAILFQIIIAYFVSDQISYANFERKYINVMSILAMFSLVFFGAMLISPSVMLLFPKTIGQVSVDYYNAIIHVFESVKGYSYLYPFRRNAGIFWEPGAYQAFLNLALYFLVKKESFGESKKDIQKFLVLSLANITTYSITGYIIYGGIVGLYYNRIRKIVSPRRIYGLIIVIIGLIVFAYINRMSMGGAFISEKFVTRFGSDARFLDRLYLTDITYMFNYPFGILGISYERYETLTSGTGNSIIQTLVTLGIPFTAMLLIMYLKYCLKQTKWLFAFIMLICMFSTESLLWRPLFLCIAWYGVYKNCSSKVLLQR